MPDTTQFTSTDGGGAGVSSLKANAVLQNRYRIMGVIGGGGMGTVYQARDLNFAEVKKYVAVKEMHTLTADAGQRASMLKTFRREANLLAELSHPAIPRIFDTFDLNDRAYIVMEFINGSDLEMLLQKTRDLPVDKVLDWAIELCDALEYLHNQEPDPIVFRDMKPSNVMIDNLGRVRLIDFGIAKTFVGGTSVKHTSIGTEGYSAPEQYTGDVSPQSDLFSLGATLHHILTRKDPRLEPPFSFHERPITQFNPNVHPTFVQIIDRALTTNAKDRYKSCAEMKGALIALRSRSSLPVQAISGVVTGIEHVPTAGAAPIDNATAGTGTDFFQEGAGAIQPKWVFKAEDEIRSSPVAMGDLAFFGAYDYNLWAVNLESGELVWKFPTKGGIASSPVIDATNRLVLFGSDDNTFYAVDYRSGRLSWSHMTKNPIRSTPRVEHGHVFFGSDDAMLYAISVANGRELWKYDATAPIRCRPFVTNELIIFGTEAGEILAVSLSGNFKWRQRAKRGVISSPIVNLKEAMCYIGASDNFLYAIDINNGFPAWTKRTNGPIVSSPVERGNVVYVTSTDGSLWAINAQTGRERWKFTTQKPIVGSPAIKDDLLYFGGTDGYFYCIGVDDGKERWKYKTGKAITSTPYITDNAILIGSLDHHLYAFPLVG